MPSEILCVDESISRWYRFGVSSVDEGSPHSVALDRKPERGGEFYDVCDGQSKIMMKF